METRFYWRLWRDFKVYNCGIDYIPFLSKLNQPDIIMIDGECVLEAEVAKSDINSQVFLILGKNILLENHDKIDSIHN